MFNRCASINHTNSSELKQLQELTTLRNKDLSLNPEQLIELCLKLHPRHFPSLREFLEECREKTVAVSLLAGSGSRLNQTIEQARAAGQQIKFDSNWPRALFPVENCLADSPLLVPNALYSFNALRGLVHQHVVVVRGFEEEIVRLVLAPLGIENKASFITQHCYPGLNSPAGHGDAVLQALPAWNQPRYPYVLANFAGDANSFRTSFLALLVLDTLNALGLQTQALLPVTLKEDTDYPIERNALGYLKSLRHSKLTGLAAGRTEAAQPGECNVGLWLFRREILARSAQTLRTLHFQEGSGYVVPGNKTNELALDNIMQFIVAVNPGTVRALCVARPEQITPMKQLSQIPAFVQSVRETTALDLEFRRRYSLD